ncbi:chitobiosyldiphosphodolichol beta-mannosyltransferase-like [Watersipora subatra]|uniref:chitobiosyldiphosphodolichol beta-mannosyltransferase-like n=1 Tax=Watersipora subatra TaxID=2589382 RepID=UPI00355B8606
MIMFVEFLLIVMSFIIVGLSLLLVLTLRNGSQSGDGIVTVLVLGDIGRSPRMINHTISFSKREQKVQHVGYSGTKPHSRLTTCKNVTLFHVMDTPEFHKYLPKLLAYVVKALWQSSCLLWTLCQTEKSSHLLLQNPPAIPTLAVAWLFCLFRCSRLIVDWHNYGYSILALATRSNHPLVLFSAWYEKWFGQCAFWGFCVTQAMQEDLKENFQIQRTDVLYDRPVEQFKPLVDEEKHKLFIKLAKDMVVFRGSDKSTTAFTKTDENGIRLLPDRPALVVSSTSWTEDEDFGILLSALDSYDKSTSAKDRQLPKLVCAITGKGPQKEHYMKLISEKKWSQVSVVTPWLEAEDYPKLLASADLGVCLHYSSSGLDLPMKVVDMFGSGLPVCAVGFKCLSELVKHEENGLIFNSPQELASQMMELLEGFPSKQEQLSKYRSNLKSFQDLTWDQHWDEVVLPRL